MKTANDFREATKTNNINYWPIHNCSLCGYECGFLFWHDAGEVVYDAGCHCVKYSMIYIRSWEDIVVQYNLNIDRSEIIEKYNQWWGFNE